ncbi:hypothetical protein SPBR_02113 [Sporothrix brasiliensis 5110]|uniref:Uncharacterized protein n=1 Tax=Sporothrix brasiliensis 5110 TaxID=1398154 RepID=A0A0C2J3S9_9PEZI|nr:uncharacterized protein SPBR_02113 [Sporothrix brasiliensis 5110]KIH91722.1 hypothetical protein SPBR_02113 [Sporothrix brasiliensis 5110]
MSTAQSCGKLLCRREIASFLDKTTTTREDCDAFATGLGRSVRLKSLQLSLDISDVDRLIHGDFVPRVEYGGQLSGDSVVENDAAAAMERKDSKTKRPKEALIYVMDFILTHNAEVSEPRPALPSGV